MGGWIGNFQPDCPCRGFARLGVNQCDLQRAVQGDGAGCVVIEFVFHRGKQAMVDFAGVWGEQHQPVLGTGSGNIGQALGFLGFLELVVSGRLRVRR